MSEAAETRFLESQKARLAARSAPTDRDRQERAAAFWTALQEWLGGWSRRVEALQQDEEEEEENADQTDRNRKIKYRLTELQEELRILRRECLVTWSVGDSSAVAKQTTMSSGTNIPDTPDLSASDLQRLHQEFVLHQAKLDAMEKRLLPQGKFVFQRYRQAMTQKQKKSKSSSPETKAPTTSVGDKDDDYKQTSTTDGDIQAGILRELADCTVTTTIDGNVTLSLDDESNSIMAPRVLCDMRKVDVIIRHPLSTLHLVNIRDSQITVAVPVTGAVHVTNCRNTQLKLVQCQQLRLHHSTQVECQGAITAGGILEGCMGIVFHCQFDDPELTVRDFHWLRSDVPSPNYEVKRIASPPAPGKSSRQDCAPGKSTRPTSAEDEPLPVRPVVTANKDDDDDDDDDDEL